MVIKLKVKFCQWTHMSRWLVQMRTRSGDLYLFLLTLNNFCLISGKLVNKNDSDLLQGSALLQVYSRLKVTFQIKTKHTKNSEDVEHLSCHFSNRWKNNHTLDQNASNTWVKIQSRNIS